jgi:hypothetical protein
MQCIGVLLRGRRPKAAYAPSPSRGGISAATFFFSLPLVGRVGERSEAGVGVRKDVKAAI